MNTLRHVFALLMLVGLCCQFGCDTSGSVRWKSETMEGDPVAAECPPGDRLPVAVLSAPASGSVIASELYEDLSGIAEPLPRGWKLYVFASDRFRWYPQHPACAIDPRTGTFRHRNIRLHTDTRQEFELHICVVEPNAVRQLEGLAERGDYAGLLSLPDGVHPADSIVIYREPSGPSGW